MNISINFREEQKNTMQPGFIGTVAAGKKQEEQKNSLFAGNMNLTQDPVQERLESARKKAYKIVSDAFNADKDFTRRMDKLKDFAREQKDERAAAM